jgi:hypothetical protein
VRPLAKFSMVAAFSSAGLLAASPGPVNGGRRWLAPLRVFVAAGASRPIRSDEVKPESETRAVGLPGLAAVRFWRIAKKPWGHGACLASVRPGSIASS